MSRSLQPFHARENDLHGHSESVTCLAFSPLGDCLASGGEDGNLIVWDPMKGTLLHRVPVSGAITSMAWDPDDNKHRIFVGTANGTIFAINDFDCVPEQGLDSSVLTGVDAPVYAIAIDAYSGVLALGMGSEVHLAKWVAPNHYATFKILPPPPELPNTPQDTDKRVRVRALAFREGGHHLLATYLSHGIVCWDLVHPQTQLLWTTVPMHSHRLIGHSLLSPDEQTLLIYNLSEGMDLYKIRHCHPYRRFKYISDTGENIPVQVTFLHDGRAAACGSTDGNVTVWDIANKDQIQVLPHDGHPVQAISAYQYRHFALLAAGTSHSSENTYIRVWRSDTRSSRAMIMRFIHRKMVQSHRICRALIDRRVADLIPWRWLPILFAGVILVISLSATFIRIEVSYIGQGRLAAIGQINLAEILNGVSNNVKQIRRGAGNVLGSWARALQGEEGNTVDT